MKRLLVCITTLAIFIGLAACGSSSQSSESVDADTQSTESTDQADSADADAKGELSVADIESIQAYTDETMYGTGLVEVEITYREGVDVSNVTPDTYILEDRGSLSPDFGQIAISDVSIEGQVVTLTIDDGSKATENNTLIYTGDDAEGVRERNVYGIYPTGFWYRDVAGVIYYGDEDSDEYKANETGMGYQSRECLELKLRHSTEDESVAACLAGEDGKYDATGLWKETIDRQFGEGNFLSFEDLDIEIPSTANEATDGTQDDYVRGYAYVPDDYDPANGIIFTIQGQGISYWKLPDGTDDDGTGIRYDSATTSWADTGAIVVNIHDRSSAGPGEYYDIYDFVLDDVNVMKYFIDTYGVTGNIVVQGNSRGTMACSMIIKALAGQAYNPQNQKADTSLQENTTLPEGEYDFTVDTFICQNGFFGYGYDDDDWAAVAETGLRVWAFDGEQDTNNVDNITLYTELMSGIKGADWAKENIRLTGYPSELYYYWGESDHSTTRINGWYFDDAAYYGPDMEVVDGEIVYNTQLKDGDTYTLECRGSAAGSSKDGYEYTVYDDLFHEWALSIENTSSASASAPDADLITSIQATVVANFYGYKVGTVEITYEEGTDLDGVNADCFTLYDRGFNNPQFGKVEITDASVDGNVVTLSIDQGTDKVTDRTRETYGTLCTSANWYVDSEGNVHYGDEETTDALGITILPNTIGHGLQRRENMDLILCVNTDDITKGIRSTDGAGTMLVDTIWQEAILSDDLDKVELEMVDVGWQAEGYTMLGDQGKVPVHVIYPDDYDPNRDEPYPVIDYQCGGGVCYWEVTDSTDGTVPANNPGCNVVYDVMMTEWHRQMPDAIIISVNVHSSDTENAAKEIAGVLDYAIENWNADKNRIILVGNSQGTIISSDVIRQRPELIAGYVECNGNLGGMAAADEVDGTLAHSSLSAWSEAQVQAMIDNEVSVWMFNGETDGDNPAAQQDIIEIVKDLYREEGKSESWIDAHVRASGLQSWKFKDWGETDHSVTKVVAWYYLGSPYLDVEKNTELEPGDTYKYSGTEEDYANYEYTMDYEYTVYAESVAEWVQNVFETR